MSPISCTAFSQRKNAANSFALKHNPISDPSFGGIARKNGFKALIVGGTEDHVHILLSLPAVMPSAKAVQLLKGSSSRWMNETHTKGFAWEEGYGAFTFGVSQKPRTIDYIKSQAEHSSEDEF
jgi:putative transposase